jgi:[ribosomal protein S5]-alanine N-acetyltransferase
MGRTEFLPRQFNGIVLRRLALADLVAFQGYRTDAVLGQYQGWSPMSDTQAAAFLKEMSTAVLIQPGVWCQLGIAKAENQTLIGDIGLLLARDGRYAEIGFTLSRQWQGQGIATISAREAINLVFEVTEAEQVIGITDSRNISSIRLLERVGMRRIKSVTTVFRDEPCIEYTYALDRQIAG